MNDPVVIEPLSSLWLTGIAVSIIISVMVVQVGVRIPPDKRRILMLFVGLFILGIETWQQFYFSHLGVWTVEKSLPIHLCGISAIIAGIMMIKANQNGFEFLALIGSPGALHAILTPQLNHGYDILLVYKYYISHTAIILIPLFLAIVQGYRVRKSAWLKVMIMVQVLIIFIGTANYLFHSNYMYLAARPLVDNPMIVGEWPWYIIGFEFLGLIHILIFYFGYRKMRPLPF